MTLLSAIQSVSSHPAVGQSTSVAAVIGATDPAVVQMQALLQQEADELLAHDWSGLLTSANFTLAAPVSSVITASLPADFQRFVQNSTLFHVGQQRDTVGPVSSREWQVMLYSVLPTADAYWRRIGDTLQFVGAAQSDVINYEYISKYPIASSGGTAQASFAADTDTLRVPEKLAVLGAIWRWRSAKGMDYSQEKNTYDRAYERLSADDRAIGVRMVSMTGVGMARRPPTTITA